MWFRVWGLRFRVLGFGFRGLGFEVLDLRAKGLVRPPHLSSSVGASSPFGLHQVRNRFSRVGFLIILSCSGEFFLGPRELSNWVVVEGLVARGFIWA